MSEPRYACTRCGTWKCTVCPGWEPGAERTNTDVRYVSYPCGCCRGRAGILVPTMHTATMWARHNDGPLPEAYVYGSRPPAGQWAPGFGAREVPPLRYRGVLVPDRPMDMDAFRCGVDAALDAVSRKEAGEEDR